MNAEIEVLIENVYEIADDILDNSENKVRDLIRDDMIDFLLYIADTDQKITFKESGVIAYYFNFKNLTPEKGKKLIRGKKNEFKKSVPRSMKIMVQYSKYFQEKKENTDIQIPAIELYALYKRIGKIIVSVGDYPHEKRENALERYLLILEKYIRNELQYFAKGAFDLYDDILLCGSIDYSSPRVTDGYYFANIEESAKRNKCKEEHYTFKEFIERVPSYKKGIENIQEEFIKKGLEKFLLTGRNFDIANRKSTEEYILKAGDLKSNKYVLDFINQFENIDYSNEVAFIFPESYANNCFEAKEICKNAKEFRIIKNLFPGDAHVHWLATFEKAEVLDIILMFHIIYSGVMGDNFGGYKLFGYGLTWYADNLQYKGTVLRSPWIPDYLTHFQGHTVQRNNPHMIVQVRYHVQYMLEQGYFDDELDIFRNLYQVLMPYLHKWYEETYDYVNNNDINIDWKFKRLELKSKLVADGIIKSKWKHERILYGLVKEVYPDAIYQYHSKWLGMQSIDIFIPQLSIGIEYQGIQHYEPIDFFGGEEGFLKRQELDNRKRELCLKNNVRLIEWNYNLEPTKINLQRMLFELME